MNWSLRVEGMTCGGCAGSVERVLRAVVPDAAVSVQWKEGTVRVAAAVLDEAEIRARLEAAGFALTAFAAEP